MKLFKLFFLSLLFSKNLSAQNDTRLVSEVSVGLKVIIGDFIYGKLSAEDTGLKTQYGVQPTIRYDLPIKLFTVRETDLYIWLMAQTGLLYINSQKYTNREGYDINGNLKSFNSRTPLYVPVSAGIYLGQKFSYGFEVFYAKALNNVEDIWGTKLISLGWNAKRFRVSVAYEVYAQVKQKYNGGPYGSFQFLWKLKKQTVESY